MEEHWRNDEGNPHSEQELRSANWEFEDICRVSSTTTRERQKVYRVCWVLSRVRGKYWPIDRKREAIEPLFNDLIDVQKKNGLLDVFGLVDDPNHRENFLDRFVKYFNTACLKILDDAPNASKSDSRSVDRPGTHDWGRRSE